MCCLIFWLSFAFSLLCWLLRRAGEREKNSYHVPIYHALPVVPQTQINVETVNVYLTFPVNYETIRSGREARLGTSAILS